MPWTFGKWPPAPFGQIETHGKTASAVMGQKMGSFVIFHHYMTLCINRSPHFMGVIGLRRNKRSKYTVRIAGWPQRAVRSLVCGVHDPYTAMLLRQGWGFATPTVLPSRRLRCRIWSKYTAGIDCQSPKGQVGFMMPANCRSSGPVAYRSWCRYSSRPDSPRRRWRRYGGWTPRCKPRRPPSCRLYSRGSCIHSPP